MNEWFTAGGSQCATNTNDKPFKQKNLMCKFFILFVSFLGDRLYQDSWGLQTAGIKKYSL